MLPFSCPFSLSPFLTLLLPAGRAWPQKIRVETSWCAGVVYVSVEALDCISRGLWFNYFHLSFVSTGTCRPCLVGIVPVKNEEGLVIMFILDFQELIDPSHKRTALRQRITQGWAYCKAFHCPYSFHLCETQNTHAHSAVHFLSLSLFLTSVTVNADSEWMCAVVQLVLFELLSHHSGQHGHYCLI